MEKGTRLWPPAGTLLEAAGRPATDKQGKRACIPRRRRATIAEGEVADAGTVVGEDT